MGDKTEKPTEKKLRDARAKGQVAQSQDFVKLLGAIALLEAITLLSGFLGAEFDTMMLSPFQAPKSSFQAAAGYVTMSCLAAGIRVTVVFMLIALIVKIGAAWIQFGFLFAPEAVKIDFNRLNPISTAKQFFSLKKLTELISNIIKTVIVISVLFFILQSALPTLLILSLVTLEESWHYVMMLFSRIEHIGLGCLGVLAIADFALQRVFHMRDMKMEKHEVKREYKDSQGDPMMKGHRRALAQQLLNEVKPISFDTENVDAVVVNPTHFAVGIFYRPESTPLPIITHKATEEGALAMIKMARENKIPIIRYQWLARTLHGEGEVGDVIPRSTLHAMAAVYRVLREVEESMDDGLDIDQDRVQAAGEQL